MSIAAADQWQESAKERAIQWQEMVVDASHRWQERADSADAIAESNFQISQAYSHNAFLLETVSTLATENGYLCERDAKAMQVVAEFDEENHRLKTSLAEACKRLEEQSEELNELLGQMGDLYYKLAVLEQALDRIPVWDNINITVPNPR
jgi:chromosome segregation ATPase